MGIMSEDKSNPKNKSNLMEEFLYIGMGTVSSIYGGASTAHTLKRVVDYATTKHAVLERLLVESKDTIYLSGRMEELAQIAEGVANNTIQDIGYSAGFAAFTLLSSFYFFNRASRMR